jgi:rod shape-determining protein MreD
MTVMADRIGWSVRGAVGASIPFVCAVLGVVASNIPVSIFGALVPPPMFGLMPIYFWCLVRPDLMPPFAVFVIGVLQDLLSGGQAGVWTLSFVAAYAVVDRERDSFAGLAGIGAILGFAAAMLVAGASAYAIISIYYWRLPPVAPIVVEIAISVVFYIPVAVILGVIHRRLVGPLRGDF